MQPTNFPEANLILHCPEPRNQCSDLAVFSRGEMVISRWEFEPEELEELTENAALWLWIHSDQISPVAMVNPLPPFAQKKPVVIGVKQTLPPPREIPATRLEGAFRVDGYTIYKFKFSGVALREAKKAGALWVAIVNDHYPPISLNTAYPFNAPEDELDLITIELPTVAKGN